MGEMTLQQFDDELVARGFDAYSPATRFRYINWGYRRIARRARWLWEQTSITSVQAVGDFDIVITPGSGGPIANFKSITRVYVTAPADRRAKLRHLTDEEFFEKWYPLDLSLAANRSSVPEGYYIWENALYILPPSNQQITVQVHYKQQVTALVNGSDIPITPPDLDEAILTAALQRAHKRANELQLAEQSRAELEEVFADMATDEVMMDEEEQERVAPDDTWL
jgi:hypothetical protein